MLDLNLFKFIDNRRCITLDQFLQQMVNGLSLGSIYALIALGYTMVYGIIKLINFAHGDIYMIGAYIGFAATTYVHLGFPCTYPIYDCLCHLRYDNRKSSL